LTDALGRNSEEDDPDRDFGQDLLPGLIGLEAIYAFDYCEGGTGGGAYWRDAGTVDAYFQANMHLLGEAPELDLYDKAWPIYSFQPSLPPAKVALAPRPPGRPESGLHDANCETDR
jgi:glucose-1-phosphate adenylyltransferase